VADAIPQPWLFPASLFPTEILLVRHGRSAAIVPGSDESFDPPLAEEGHAQAQALARRLEGKHLDAVYASDLRRAVDTAEYLARDRSLSVTTRPELREVHLGDWEGGEFRRRAAALDPDWLAFAASGRWDMVPGSEGDAAFRARATRAIDAVIDAHPAGSVAVVCHGGVINAYLAELLGIGRSTFTVLENTSVTLVRAGAGAGTNDQRARVVVTVNDAHHLYDPVTTAGMKAG
jgi:probable phosphoglycerate mutase